MAEHLGEKLIMTLRIGGFAISFDLITIIMSWIVMLILIIGALLLRRGMRSPEEEPSRRQAALEWIVGGLRTWLGSGFQSEELANKLFPLMATVLLYVLFSNWLSLIPGLESPTADLNVTLSLGIMVFFLAQFWGMRRKGPGGYIKSFFKPYPFFAFLNVISELAKVLSHSFRLFGNVLGGAILITIVASFMPLVVPLFFHIFYDIFVGAIQALVFAFLAVAYVNIAAER